MAELGEKMSLTNIPEDIKKISRKKIIRRILILIAVYALEAVIAVIFKDTFYKRGINSIAINTAVMLFVPIPFLMIPLKFDASWVGKIHSCKVVTKDSYTFDSSENRITLDLINGDEVLTKEISFFDSNRDLNIGRYKKDCIAIHIFGTKYAAVLPENENDKIICVVCGKENDFSDTNCSDCGHSLLNKNNIKQVH